MLPPEIGGTIYINLDRRQDRREQFEAEAAKMNLPVERFSAIERSPGILGCGLSHLAVLKLARERDWPSVLIFEDDFEFLVSPAEFRSQLESALKDEGDNWDVLMLSYAHEVREPHSKTLFRIQSAQTASGYIVHKRLYTELIDLFERAMESLATTGRHWDYANDQVWKQIQPHKKWFGFTTRLGRQRASFSDTSWSHADYGV
jgi:glycosyl transferase family 25